MKNIIIFGPPSAGKGTQAKNIVEKYNVKHISTGDIFRYNIKNETDLGLQVKEYLNTGALVPDELTVKVLASALTDEGFLLDGFPRNVNQFKELVKILENRNQKIDYIIRLLVDDDELIKRVTGRRVCDNNHTFNVNTEELGSNCKICGHELFQRADDTLETFMQRLNIYKEQTMPLVDYFKEFDNYYEIKQCNTPECVFELIEEVIGE